MNKKIVKGIESYLEKQKITYFVESNEHFCIFTFKMGKEEREVFEIRVGVCYESDFLEVIAIFPEIIPQESLNKLYPIINELNYWYTQNRITFIYNPQERQLFCMNTVDVDSNRLNEKALENSIHLVFIPMDKEYERIKEAVS